MGPTACCLQPLRDPQHFLLIHYNSHLRWKTGGTTRGGGGVTGIPHNRVRKRPRPSGSRILPGRVLNTAPGALLQRFLEQHLLVILA